jgi:hypothetical protein
MNRHLLIFIAVFLPSVFCIYSQAISCRFLQCPIQHGLCDQLNTPLIVNQIMRGQNSISCLDIAVKADIACGEWNLHLSAISKSLIRLEY